MLSSPHFYLRRLNLLRLHLGKIASFNAVLAIKRNPCTINLPPQSIRFNAEFAVWLFISSFGSFLLGKDTFDVVISAYFFASGTIAGPDMVAIQRNHWMATIIIKHLCSILK